MPSVDESVTAAGGAAALLAGLRTLSLDEEIPFTRYIRYVLPLDGYVFWLKTETITVRGSMHHAADTQQREDETLAINRVIFSTATQVQPFDSLQPESLWIGTVGRLRFAFSQRGFYYRASNLWHYSGNSVYPALESQIVDVGAELPADTLVVSNSLPAWLTLKTYSPIWLVAPNPGVTLYPSFLVSDNLRPPYGAVHIEPAQTNAIGAAPLIGLRGLHTQLATDHVRITLYGLTNAEALAFFDLVNQYSLDTDNIGIMNMPVMRDEKRTQNELNVLAMKKTIEFDVSYYQTAMPNVARQLIEAAMATFVVQARFPPPIPPTDIYFVLDQSTLNSGAILA